MPFHRGRAKLRAALLKAIRIVLICLLAVSASACLRAQTAVDGAISGFVLDTTGAALPGAVIRIHELSTGQNISAISGSKGEFTAPHVAAGQYRLTVEYAHFESLTLDSITVEAGAVTSVEARLRVGSVATAVTVTAAPAPAPAILLEEPSGSAIAATITPAEVQTLPLDGRSWQDLALLTPTVNSAPDAPSLLTFRGIAVTQNSTRIDGADDDQSFGGVPRGSGGDSVAEAEDAAEAGTSSRSATSSPDGGGGYGRHSGMAYTFSQEAVREIRVSGQNYSALYGHAAGGIVTTISKSGTNTIHGTTFYLIRTSALGATNPFSFTTNYANGAVTGAYVKPHDVRQQLGGSAGGPILHNRLFWFYAYDQQLRGFPAISTPEDPDFYNLTPTQRALLANRGVAPSKINTALSYLDSLTGTIPRRHDQNINFAKLDWRATRNHRLSLQYNRARSSAPGGARSAPVVDYGTGSLGSSYARLDSALGRWLWTATPKLSHELRLQYGRDLQYEIPSPPLPQEPAISLNGYAPEVAIGPDGLTFGTPTSAIRKAYPNERKLEAADILTWVLGRHQLQIGGDVSLVHDTIDALNNQEGAFHYDSGVTNGHAGGIVDWITDYTFSVTAYPNGGCPSIVSATHDFCFRSFTQSFGRQSVTFDTQEWAGFFQEKWTLRPTLTLNAGLRYEYELLPIPQQPNLAIDSIFSQQGATSIFPEDRNNFGPRAGIAWQPFGYKRGVIRLGYGLFYGKLPGATIRSALVNTATSSAVTSVLILPATVTNCPQVANQGFGYPCAYTSTPPASIGNTTSAMVFDRRFRLPAVQQASFSIEHEIAAGTIASATYLLNLDRQLTNSTDINIAPSTGTKLFQLQGGTGKTGVQDGETFVLPVYTQRISTNFGPITDITSNTNASYNALILEARRRARRGLEFRASWTWSKALDFGQAAATPRTNAQLDPFDIRYDKGLSSLNFPHKILVTAVWTPNPHTDLSWLRAATHGWALAPIFTQVSGRPYSMNIFGGTRLTGGHESINGSGGAVYLPTIGRNTLRLPGTSHLDLRLSRALHVAERMQLRATAEAFNLTNHVNYSAIQQRAFLVGTAANGITPLVFQNAAAVASEGLNVQPFGTFTAASGSQAQERQVQLGLRFEF